MIGEACDTMCGPFIVNGTSGNCCLEDYRFWPGNWYVYLVN